MNKIKICLIFSILMIISFCLNVYAESPCSSYHTLGEAGCESKSFNGYKCEWDGTKKAGARCYRGDKLTDEKKEQITACEQIKDGETCRASQVEGHECIWRQGACHDNALIDDGTDETIIADDQNDRNNAENNNNENENEQQQIPQNNLDDTVLGVNICSEKSVIKILKLVGSLLVIVKIVIPLLLFVYGVIDLSKAIIGKDEKELPKSLKNFFLRVLGGIFIFFIPTIVNFTIDLINETMNNEKDNQCITCVLDTKNC